MSDRNRKRIIVASVVVLVLLGSWMMGSRSHSGTMEVTFIGWTNNPQETYPAQSYPHPQNAPIRVCVTPPDATGRCALFRVTNAHKTGVLWFKTTAIETKDGATWNTWQTFPLVHTVIPMVPWQGASGSSWHPGTSMLYAIGTPPGVPSNTCWRMRVSVTLEPTGFRQYANEKLGQKLLRLYSWHVITSSEVPAQ